MGKGKNIGSVPGRAVVQLYLAYPRRLGEAGYPLRGFNRTEVLQPQTVITVAFSLGLDEMGVWDAAQGKFVVQPGTYTVIVSESSNIGADWTTRMDFTVPDALSV